MPNPQIIVINTSPLIALVAAWGNLDRLQPLYQQILVPFEVVQEILQGGLSNFGVAEFQAATWLVQQQQPINISPFLRNSLDLGEASVIQLALDRSIETVCIDDHRLDRHSTQSQTTRPSLIRSNRNPQYAESQY